jgi:GT2 family glycosyltransferase
LTDRPGSRTESAPRSTVRFSIIVPTYERPAHIAACVAALRRLERPGGRLEIVIVNDGGAPLSASLASGALEDGCDVRVIDQENAGPGPARNAGAAVARGELLAFTDDDCRPDAGWLVAFDAALRAEPKALAGGRTVNALTSNPYAEASQRLVDFVEAYFQGGVRGRFFTSNNLAVSREEFLAIGGFATRFTRFTAEDREFCDRWSAEGRPSVSVPNAIVQHYHDLSAVGFLRQHFGYGRGAAGFRRVRAEAGRPGRVDPAFYAESLRYAAHGRGLHGVVDGALVALAHAAQAAGLLYESSRRGGD